MSVYRPWPAEQPSTPDELEIDQRTPRLDLFETDLTSRDVRPETVLQALMEAGPGDALAESIEECGVLHEAVRYAADCLSPEDTYILNSIASEGVTYEELSHRLGTSKSQGWRLHQRAVARLRILLLNHPPVRERLGMEPTWNAAAMHELIEIAGYDESWPAGTPDYLLADAVVDIGCGIELAKRFLNEEKERLAVHALSEAAEYAVAYLRRIDEWSLLDMHTLLCGKQQDYGHQNILAFGMMGVVVRASDKAARLKNLTARVGVNPANESLIDTFRDVVGYAVVARMLKAETFELNLETTTNESESAA